MSESYCNHSCCQHSLPSQGWSGCSRWQKEQVWWKLPCGNTTRRALDRDQLRHRWEGDGHPFVLSPRGVCELQFVVARVPRQSIHLIGTPRSWCWSAQKGCALAQEWTAWWSIASFVVQKRSISRFLIQNSNSNTPPDLTSSEQVDHAEKALQFAQNHPEMIANLEKSLLPDQSEVLAEDMASIEVGTGTNPLNSMI